MLWFIKNIVLLTHLMTLLSSAFYFHATGQLTLTGTGGLT